MIFKLIPGCWGQKHFITHLNFMYSVHSEICCKYIQYTKVVRHNFVFDWIYMWCKKYCKTFAYICTWKCNYWFQVCINCLQCRLISVFFELALFSPIVCSMFCCFQVVLIAMMSAVSCGAFLFLSYSVVRSSTILIVTRTVFLLLFQ